MQHENSFDIFDEQAFQDWATEDLAGENEAAVWRGTVAALAFAVPQGAPSAGLRERLLAGVAAPRDVEKPFVSPALLSVRSDEGNWREILPGVQFKKLFVDKKNDTLTGLYRLAPGATIEAHRHRGYEQTYILEGDCRVGEMVFGAGDFQCAPANSAHETLSTVNGTLLLIMSPLGYEAVV